MFRWTIHDRYGNEIYLTQERWDYILRYHNELDGLLDELLDTLGKGRRRRVANNFVISAWGVYMFRKR